MTPCPATQPRCQHSRATDYFYYGCRCDAARQDRELHRKQRHLLPPPLVDATGVRRRLQALMAIGWPSRELARRLGRDSGALGRILWTASPHRRVTRELHADVNALYDQLWDQAGPSLESRRRAAARGWPPPLFWDDMLIDNPLYDGSREYQQDNSTNTFHSSQRRAEFRAQVAVLTRRGWSTRRIAEDTGRPTRAVTRARAALRQAELTAPGSTLQLMQQAAS